MLTEPSYFTFLVDVDCCPWMLWVFNSLHSQSSLNSPTLFIVDFSEVFYCPKDHRTSLLLCTQEVMDITSRMMAIFWLSSHLCLAWLIQTSKAGWFMFESKNSTRHNVISHAALAAVLTIVSTPSSAAGKEEEQRQQQQKNYQHQTRNNNNGNKNIIKR